MTADPHRADPNHSELLALLTLRFTPQLGPRRIELLRRHFGSATAALQAGLGAWRQVEGLDSRSAAALGTPEAAARAQRELDSVQRAGHTLLGRGLPGYPEALEALPDPPAVLWVRGALLELAVVPRAIGIVGTRRASPHALALTRQLAGDLARADVIVVSGFARGIDTAAHKATLEAGGRTLAVLGCGVDVVYPPENRALATQLPLVSEHPLGTPPNAHNFPGRNRIIAALSAGSVIVEGDLKSGAMITAGAALECGRTVFAVPGRAGDPMAAGPHRLLREGAVLTEGAEDIFQELHWRGAAPLPAPDLPPEQQRAWAALDTPLTLDDVAHRAGLDVPAAQMALVMLQLSGLIDEQPGGRYARR